MDGLSTTNCAPGRLQALLGAADSCLQLNSVDSATLPLLAALVLACWTVPNTIYYTIPEPALVFVCARSRLEGNVLLLRDCAPSTRGDVSCGSQEQIRQ
jgi:hypothetical protein